MQQLDELLVAVVSSAGGEVTGRVRLQKIFYLLQAKGMSSEIQFRYHHFGPYSKSIDAAIDKAKALNGLDEVIEYRKSDGIPYSVFRSQQSNRVADKLGQLPLGAAKELLAKMTAETSTVLELAATIHWLYRVEGIASWRDELERRKGTKTAGGRAERAAQFLDELGIGPSSLVRGATVREGYQQV
jgi:uncharacterized protein YwgA